MYLYLRAATTVQIVFVLQYATTSSICRKVTARPIKCFVERHAPTRYNGTDALQIMLLDKHQNLHNNISYSVLLQYSTSHQSYPETLSPSLTVDVSSVALHLLVLWCQYQTSLFCAPLLAPAMSLTSSLHLPPPIFAITFPSIPVLIHPSKTAYLITIILVVAK